MLKVEFNGKDFERRMGQYKSQMPFVLSKTINGCMKKAQTDVIADVSKKFTIRRANFVKLTFKITQWSNKRKLTGVFGTADIGGRDTSGLLAKFEDGGTKLPKGSNIAIPTAVVQPNKGRMVTSAKRPRNLVNSFKVKTKTGQELIMVKKGRGKRKKVQTAYILEKAVRVDNRLNFYETVERSIRNNVDQIFHEEFEKAVATIK